MTGQSAAITLLGATGFTGQKIARCLARDGLDFRLAGRSAEKLEALSRSLPGQPTWLSADAARPASISSMLQGTRLLINCAGPFTDLGERVISQAAMAGIRYLDITNELGYVFRARTYGEMARRSGAALVPACGFEVCLADCLADLLARDALHPSRSTPLDRIDVVYSLGGMGGSTGTRRSAVRSLATSWIAYRDGKWVGQVPGGKVRRFPLPVGSRYAFNIPSSESVTLPAHIPVQRVDVWMAANPGTRFWAPVGIPLLARLSRSILRGAILSLASLGGSSPAGPAEPARARKAPFTIWIEAERGGRIRRAALSGDSPYALTAEIVSYAAGILVRPDYQRKGLLAPAQALDPADLLCQAQEKWGADFKIDVNET